MAAATALSCTCLRIASILELVGEDLDLPDEVYGFGSWLLNSLFKQAQFDYAPAGLRCGLDMPLGRGRPA